LVVVRNIFKEQIESNSQPTNFHLDAKDVVRNIFKEQIESNSQQKTGLSYKNGKEQLALPLWLLRSQNHDDCPLPG